MIALLCSCVQEGRDGVVSPRSPPQERSRRRALHRVSRMPELQAAQVMGSTGPRAAQTKADRVNVLVSFQHRAVARIEPP